MYSFGYKMGWFAIRNASRDKILSALGLTIIKEICWDEGIDTIHSEYDEIVFVTPAVNDWTFVVGRWTADPGEKDSVHDIEKLITNLSMQFEEVQAFATHHVVEYHHWMLAKNGRLVRSFAYLGESGEVLTNKGKLTQIEKSYDWDQLDESEWLPDEETDEETDMEELDEDIWFPDEETVMEVAGSWSINPTTFEELSLEELGLDEDIGILAYTPKFKK
jgi:hypothetical protein